MAQRNPTTVYLWLSRLAGGAGIVCIILALISGAMGRRIVIATPSTLVLLAIAAFLFAIWAIAYEIRDYGLKTK